MAPLSKTQSPPLSHFFQRDSDSLFNDDTGQHGSSQQEKAGDLRSAGSVCSQQGQKDPLHQNVDHINWIAQLPNPSLPFSLSLKKTGHQECQQRTGNPLGPSIRKKTISKQKAQHQGPRSPRPGRVFPANANSPLPAIAQNPQQKKRQLERKPEVVEGSGFQWPPHPKADPHSKASRAKEGQGT